MALGSTQYSDNISEESFKTGKSFSQKIALKILLKNFRW